MLVRHAPPQPRLSLYVRERILHLLRAHASVAETVDLLKREGIRTCRQTVWRIRRLFEAYSTIKPLPKSGCPTKLPSAALQSIENLMQSNDETTSKELRASLLDSGIYVSITTALKGRRLFGWTRRGTAYCQLIRAPNRVKRLEWAQRNVGKTFNDVIWSDETSVQMELTGDSTATKGVENLDTKLTRSILLKFTSGQV